MPGFAQQHRVSKLRVINPGSDSLEVESLSSAMAMAPPPCYSSYKEETMTTTTVCLGDSMEYSPNEDNRNAFFESDPPSVHSVAANPEAAPPAPWLEESPPSPYSLDDLPKITHQLEMHNYLGPAAPSSTYTQSFGLGVSRSQSTHDMLATPCDSHITRTPNSTSDPHSFISPLHTRFPVGHSSTPNMSSRYQHGNSQNQVLYRHIPVSQPLLGRLPYLPNVVTGPESEITPSRDEPISTPDGNYSSGLSRGFSSTSGSSPFSHIGQGLPMNFVSLSRKSTNKRRTFPLTRKTNSSSIMGVFIIDPYLRLPAGLLKVVDSNCPPLDEHSTSFQPRRKNLVLETENGGIDVDIHITPSKVSRQIDSSFYPPLVSQPVVPQQPEPRRSTDKRYLQPENQAMRRSVSQPRLVIPETDSVDARIPTRLDLLLKDHSHGTSEKFQLIARINAPTPRPPIHLVASTIDRAPSAEPITSPAKRAQSRRLQSRSHPHRNSQADESNKSPVMLHIPPNFHGPLTVHITAGNIDAHVRLSKELSRVAAILNENSVTRGYFISSSGLTEFGGRSRFGEDLDMEGEDGWVVVEEMGQSHGVVNNGQPFLSMPRGGDRIGRDEEWYGDKVDVFVGDGKVYLQFLDEPNPFGTQKGFWKKLVIGLGCR